MLLVSFFMFQTWISIVSYLVLLHLFAGVYSRMFKFELKPEPGSDADISSIQKSEEHTIALLRTVDMNPSMHASFSSIHD